MTALNLCQVGAVFRVMPTVSDSRAAAPGALRTAVDALCGPYLHPSAGIALASVLAQLEDAAEPSGGAGSGSANRYKSPAALDVLALLAEIDRVTTMGVRASGYRKVLPDTREGRVRLWATFAGRWRAVNPDYLARAVSLALSWRERALAVVMPDPPTIEPRAQPCPACGERVALVWSAEYGTNIQRPSLYLDKDSLTVYCRCCDAKWGSALWGLLRRVLDAG